MLRLSMVRPDLAAATGHRWLRDALLASVKSRIDRDAELLENRAAQR